MCSTSTCFQTHVEDGLWDRTFQEADIKKLFFETGKHFQEQVIWWIYYKLSTIDLKNREKEGQLPLFENYQYLNDWESSVIQSVSPINNVTKRDGAEGESRGENTTVLYISAIKKLF